MTHCHVTADFFIRREDLELPSSHRRVTQGNTIVGIKLLQLLTRHERPLFYLTRLIIELGMAGSVRYNIQ